MICSTCKEIICGAVYLLSEQKGQWCSIACRNEQIVPFAIKSIVQSNKK